jgi:exodeoxyribonuclease VII small subunit
MDKKEYTPVEELAYEQALAELEEIVTALESEERSLDNSMSLFERGQSLARYCAGLLDQAELKVQQISGENLTDFEPEDE